MAVFRVEKNKGYTVMSNHHLRNKELSLKAKGLLSQMLSLPEDWDYTLAGLSLINRESIDAIRTAVWELEKAGYITRRQGRDEKGKMTAIEYTIYEQPQPLALDCPVLENPTADKPILENPTPDNPTSENPTQLNKELLKTNLPKKEKLNTDVSSTHSIPSDYKQGSATAEYRHYVDEAVQLAERQKQRVDPMYHEKIDSLLDTYARKLAANMNKGYEIDARVPSILIAGGSNFPTRKKEKQNAARDSNYREWQDIQGLLDKIRSTGMGGISADDPQAVQKLEKKLESLEKSQETMKAVNAYYRKHKTLDGCPHLLPEQLEKLKADMASSWHLGDKPFATWALSNNSAEIRRVKDRIKSLSQQKEIGFVGWEFDGGKVEANTEANRLQIFFEDKPDEATREALKSNGFRWSPKAGAWQRQLTSNAYYAADYVKAIAPLTGEKPTELQRAHIRAGLWKM